MGNFVSLVLPLFGKKVLTRLEYLNKHLLSQGCSLDIDVDRSGGEEGDKILEWQGLTLDQCKNLAASTDRGQFWTYKRSERSCIVKETALEEALEDHSGVMSGVKECGTALPDRMLLSSIIRNPLDQQVK